MRRSHMKNTSGDLPGSCQENPAGMHLGCARGDRNKEARGRKDLQNVLELDLEPLENISVIRWVIEVDFQNMHLCVPVEL